MYPPPYPVPPRPAATTTIASLAMIAQAGLAGLWAAFVLLCAGLSGSNALAGLALLIGVLAVALFALGIVVSSGSRLGNWTALIAQAPLVLASIPFMAGGGIGGAGTGLLSILLSITIAICALSTLNRQR